ncbi:MAG TPA: pitrilysin family protein [Thermoanaerobaculia bacterium]|nr:pitrilysin family protein [Thermoanaerobaculia bacterium]HUM30316.1 pitrilysin family protein [Thermoanaerobaculia bacterium]HXK68533.1 pitrilysin family protein [Thermoanaerobaculia bacterium]
MRLHSDSLSCGLQVYHLEDPAATAASVQVWYRIGCAHEPENKRGIAHLLEHMMFKGTDSVGPEEHARTIQRLGGQSNAFTTEDVTVYFQTLPAEHGLRAIHLEADRMTNLAFPEGHFLKERGVVLEEYSERILNQPVTRALQSIRRTIFQGHPYAIDPAGIPEQVESFSREDLAEFYHRYYHPANATLITAGPHSFQVLREAAESAFDSHQRPGDPAPDIPPFPENPPSLITDRSPIRVHLHCRVYYLSRNPENFHSLQALNLLLGDGETAVMRRRIERKRMGVIHAGTFHYPTRAGHLFFVYLAVLPFLGFRNAAGELSRIMEGPTPFSPKDLEEIRGRIRISLASQLMGTEKKATRLGDCVVMRDDPDAFFRDDETFSTLSYDRIHETFRQLQQARWTTINLKARWSRAGN